MPYDRHLVRALGVAVLLLAPAVARAHGQVVLNQPGEPLAEGADFLFQAQVTGPGAGGGCHWSVAEQGRRLEPWDGVTLVEEGGGARLRVQGGAELRTLQVRATARRDSAFAVATVRVRPRSGADGKAIEARDGAGAAPPVVMFNDLKDPRLPAWNTPFTRTGTPRRTLNGIAWDPVGEPAILALERLGNRARVLRIGLDGRETVVSREAAGQLPLDELTDNLAVLPGGDIVVADTRHHRICRLTRDGTLSTLAGTGEPGFNGDTDARGTPRPAVQADLAWPTGVVTTAGGGVVFADRDNHRIRRVGPDGAIETLAGDGSRDLQMRNDLARRLPATACSIGFPNDLALAPDGRIVFTRGGAPGILVLHPDGTLGRARPIAYPALVTVTGDNAIVAWDGHQWLQRLAGTDEPTILAETRLPLQALAPGPGSGLLALDRYHATVCWIEPPKAGRGLANRVETAWQAVLAGDLGRAAAIRASLARWTGTDPPSAEVVRDHLLGTRPGSQARTAGRLPKLPDDLQAEPFEWLRDGYRSVGIRARIALYELDQALEERAAGTVDRLEALAAGR